MNKKSIINNINTLINKQYPEFSNIIPIVKKESTAIEYYTKKLNIKVNRIQKIVYSLTYIKKDKINKILRITVLENGKILKISISK